MLHRFRKYTEIYISRFKWRLGGRRPPRITTEACIPSYLHVWTLLFSAHNLFKLHALVSVGPTEGNKFCQERSDIYENSMICFVMGRTYPGLLSNSLDRNL
jgi:hypothetical protein